MIKVTVWNEFMHEKLDPRVAKIYPKGIHGCIADFLRASGGMEVRTATLDQPENGLSEEVLANTDVLTWWGHMAHEKVSDEVAERVRRHVLRGMGLIVLHSGHASKPFGLLMGTSCRLHWRDGDFERLWTVEPGHPIAKGIDRSVEIDVEEMYGERFDIPRPDEVVFLGWFAGGEVMRSGCCWTRGAGRIFYFQPGHEYNPTYHIRPIQQIITNAVRWAAPDRIFEEFLGPCVPDSPEKLRKARLENTGK